MTLLAFLTHLAFALVLFALAAAGTWFMARWVRIMDVPNARSSHSIPVPKSGGVAIVLTFVAGSFAIYLHSDVARIDNWYFLSFVGCGVLLAFVSYVDDVTQKSFFAKVVTQAVCAALVLASGLVVTSFYVPGLGEQFLPWLGYGMTFLWVMGLTNTYNFMDGLDGLAGGVAMIAAGFLCGIAYTQNSLFVYLTSYTLLAGVAGFLVFNFSPARVFMGDVGSAFLGFTFATLAIIGAKLDQGHLSFYVVPLLLFQFIFDTAFTFFRRLLRGERVHEAHRSHLYQLLNRMGYSHRQVALFHYAVAIVQGLGACVLVQLPAAQRPLVFIPFVAFHALYAGWTLRRAARRGLLS